MSDARPLGLYLHIPFCKSKCIYCDFYSLARSEEKMDAYTAALIRRWGAEKVLFGTDYPMWSQADDLAVFFEMGLTDAENRMILSENAKRVFRIQ